MRARDEGLVRFIGVTGHGVRIAGMHRRSLERFAFDSVLLPCNHLLLRDPDYAADVAALVRASAPATGWRCRRSSPSPAVAGPTTTTGPRFSWYEPLADPAAIDRAVAVGARRPQWFVNTSSDARLLGRFVAAASGELTRPGDDEIAADVDTLGITPLFDGRELERI